MSTQLKFIALPQPPHSYNTGHCLLIEQRPFVCRVNYSNKYWFDLFGHESLFRSFAENLHVHSRFRGVYSNYEAIEDVFNHF